MFESAFKKPVFDPLEWKIVKTSPGGIELQFVNTKTNVRSWHKPRGATAETMLSIPDASKCWSSVDDVKAHKKFLSSSLVLKLLKSTAFGSIMPPGLFDVVVLLCACKCICSKDSVQKPPSVRRGGTSISN